MASPWLEGVERRNLSASRVQPLRRHRAVDLDASETRTQRVPAVRRRCHVLSTAHSPRAVAVRQVEARARQAATSALSAAVKTCRQSEHLKTAAASTQCAR